MKKPSYGFALAVILAGFLVSFIPLVAHATSSSSPAEILRLTGNPSDLFGFSAGSAGDFDGDGYQDFAVGAPFRGIGGIDLYWGGPNADSVADLHLLQSNSQEGLLGFLTAPAGDFNGDGFEDIVAGLESGSLRFIVFYGGQAPDPFPDLPLSFPGSGYACEAVAAGDVNHDGYSDIIAGYGTPYSPGRVFIYFGGPGADGLPDLELTASPSDLLFPDLYTGPGKVATADWNGDGVADVIVSSASGLRVYYGGPGMDGLEDFRLTGSTIASQRIREFASAGDVNGDGADDVMIATADAEDTWVRGRVQIYYGGAGMDSVPDVTLHAQDPVEVFGPAMTSLGDTNGDGYADVLVGTSFDDIGGSGGRVDFFLGGASMDAVPDASLTSSVPNAFGKILGAADVNGDGVLDAFISLFYPTGDVLVYDFSAPLPSRAFVQGGNRTIHVGKADTPVCIRVEPVGHAYEIADIDMSTIRLVTELGSISPIPLGSIRRLTIGDTDGDGVTELPVWFVSSDFGNLFGSTRRRALVEARLEGQLASHRRFAASVTMTTMGGPHELSSVLAPNPMNPVATLAFATMHPGIVTVRVYDVAGRLVRTVLSGNHLGPGDHSVRLDGRDDKGAALGSGVYFYRIETTDGPLTGRFVIAR